MRVKEVGGKRCEVARRDGPGSEFRWSAPPGRLRPIHLGSDRWKVTVDREPAVDSGATPFDLRCVFRRSRSRCRVVSDSRRITQW